MRPREKEEEGVNTGVLMKEDVVIQLNKLLSILHASWALRY